MTDRHAIAQMNKTLRLNQEYKSVNVSFKTIIEGSDMKIVFYKILY